MDKVYRTERSIYLTGEITQDTAGDIINHLIDIITKDNSKENELKNYKREDINLYINSCGGYVTETFAIIDIIENSKTPINTYGLGRLYSSATLLFISGKNRYLGKHAHLLLHSASGVVNGKLYDMVNDMEHILKQQDTINQYYIEKTKIQLEFIEKINKEKRDYYVSPNEALELGIATEIV
jgi:ATP-dependent Clp protease protease subunit